MLLTIQIPLTDNRYFLENTGKLAIPNWSIPSPEKDFVKYFGMIRFRKRGGLEGWVGENAICEAQRIVQFPGDISIHLPNSQKRTHLKCAFRRLYFDGLVTGKYELGIGSKKRRDTTPKFIDIKEFIEHCLSINSILSLNRKHRTLINMGSELAQAYLLATTDHTFKGFENWWVAAGPPLLFLEFQTRHTDFPFPVKTIFTGKGYQLSWSLFLWRGLHYRLWLLNLDPAYKSPSKYDEARALRITLLRLNAEHESLRTILRNVDKGLILNLGDRLQHYLNVSTSKILHLENSAQNQYNEEVTRWAREAFDKISPGENLAIVNHLEKIRLNVLRKIDNYARKDASGPVNIEKIMLEVYMDNRINNSVNTIIKKNTGQIGAIGKDLNISDISIKNVVASGQKIDVEALIVELATLRKELRKEANEPEHDIAIGAVAAAEKEAKAGNEQKLLEHLSQVGTWTLDIATKIGVPIAVALIKESLGLK